MEAAMPQMAMQIRFRPGCTDQISTSGRGQVHLWSVAKLNGREKLEPAQFHTAGTPPYDMRHNDFKSRIAMACQT